MYNLHCTLYTVQCTLKCIKYICILVHCTLYNVPLYTVTCEHSTHNLCTTTNTRRSREEGSNWFVVFSTRMYAVKCTRLVVRRILYDVQCTVYAVKYSRLLVLHILYDVQCTVYAVKCTRFVLRRILYDVQCTVYAVKCSRLVV